LVNSQIRDWQCGTSGYSLAFHPSDERRHDLVRIAARWKNPTSAFNSRLNAEVPEKIDQVL
jgi:hypothetical protein